MNASVKSALNGATLAALIRHDVVTPLEQLAVLASGRDMMRAPGEGVSPELADLMQFMASRATVASEELALLAHLSGSPAPSEDRVSLADVIEALGRRLTGLGVRVPEVPVPAGVPAEGLLCAPWMLTVLLAACAELQAQGGVTTCVFRIDTVGEGPQGLEARVVCVLGHTEQGAQVSLHEAALSRRLVQRDPVGSYGWAFLTRVMPSLGGQLAIHGGGICLSLPEAVVSAPAARVAAI